MAHLMYNVESLILKSIIILIRMFTSVLLLTLSVLNRLRNLKVRMCRSNKNTLYINYFFYGVYTPDPSVYIGRK